MQSNEAERLASELEQSSPEIAFRNGLALLNADFPELLLHPSRQLFRNNPRNAKIAQLLGLAARASGIGPEAYNAFKVAARLQPNDPLIAHSHARTALEAGKRSSHLFEHAFRMNRNDGSVLIGWAAALYAEKEGEKACDLLANILISNPLWLEGHEALAKIRGQLGQDPTTYINRALKSWHHEAMLHKLRISLMLQSRKIDAIEPLIDEAKSTKLDERWLTMISAHTASELGNFTFAERQFARLLPSPQLSEVILWARHTLRMGRPDKAAELLQPYVGTTQDRSIWPYLALSWRMTDNEKYTWLEGEQSLVGVYDLKFSKNEISNLANVLRSLHLATAPPLDQSVRHGTQTDGNLLLRDNQLIQKLRTQILQASERHVANLIAPQKNHPTLIKRRHPLRISGAWSARFTDKGFHADHVHPLGWLSSAFYVSVPNAVADDTSKKGWLVLGESKDLVPHLSAFREIQPKPGRLVLFPSIMWHGTRPFSQGERMTVAFDIAIPKQY